MLLRKQGKILEGDTKSSFWKTQSYVFARPRRGGGTCRFCFLSTRSFHLLPADPCSHHSLEFPPQSFRWLPEPQMRWHLSNADSLDLRQLLSTLPLLHYKLPTSARSLSLDLHVSLHPAPFLPLRSGFTHLPALCLPTFFMERWF